MAYREPKPASGSYDQSLLASVPDPTRAEKQEGYNVDLLEEGRPHNASPPPGAAKPALLVPNRDGHSQSLAADIDPEPYIPSNPYTVGPPLKRRPWYRTRYGILGIVAAILIVIGAVVGGAVGGTRHHHHDDGAGGSGGLGSGDASQSAGFVSGPATSGAGQDVVNSSTSTSAGASQAVGGAQLAAPTPTSGSSAVQGVV